jgi:hypothetical protein
MGVDEGGKVSGSDSFQRKQAMAEWEIFRRETTRLDKLWDYLDTYFERIRENFKKENISEEGGKNVSKTGLDLMALVCKKIPNFG